MKLVDLTMPLKRESFSYPGTELGISFKRVSFDSPTGTLSRFTHLDPHCGTHLDAPLHFVRDSDDVASMSLMLPELIVVDCKANPIPVDVLDGIGSIHEKAVLFSTGWEQYADTPDYFVNFPVLSSQLAAELVARGVSLVGVDTPSVDPSGSDYTAHRTLLIAGVAILEGLVNLPVLAKRLQAGDLALLAAFPLRIEGLEGSPVRAVALIP